MLPNTIPSRTPVLSVRSVEAQHRSIYADAGGRRDSPNLCRDLDLDFFLLLPGHNIGRGRLRIMESELYSLASGWPQYIFSSDERLIGSSHYHEENGKCS